MAVYIRFNRREQSASVCRFNPDIRALNRMSVSILDGSLRTELAADALATKSMTSIRAIQIDFINIILIWLESASVSNPVEDKIVMNSVRNDNCAKPVWPKTENFVDTRSGSDQTDARTRG